MKDGEGHNYSDFLKLSTTVVLIILVTIVITVLVKRKHLKLVTTTIKLSLLLYVLSSILRFVNFFIQKYSILAPKLVQVVLMGLFLSNHWMFAWHYLQAAFLFKVTFSEHSLGQVALMQRHKKLMFFVNIAGHAILLLVYSALICLSIFGTLA